MRDAGRRRWGRRRHLRRTRRRRPRRLPLWPGLRRGRRPRHVSREARNRVPGQPKKGRRRVRGRARRRGRRRRTERHFAVQTACRGARQCETTRGHGGAGTRAGRRGRVEGHLTAGTVAGRARGCEAAWRCAGDARTGTRRRRRGAQDMSGAVDAAQGPRAVGVRASGCPIRGLALAPGAAFQESVLQNPTFAQHFAKAFDVHEYTRIA